MAKQSPTPEAPDLRALQSALAHRIAAHARTPGEHETSIPGLLLFRRTTPTPCYRSAYEPSLNVFAQGRKQVNLGGKLYIADRSSFLLSSIDVPVESQIVDASDEKPLLSMLLKLDMRIIHEILTTEELPGPRSSPATTGLAIGRTTSEMLDACLRLVTLLDTPAGTPYISRLIQREIVYRLLCSPQGARLRAIATAGDVSNRTAKAISWLRSNFRKPLHMDELADVSRMGVSTLHHQFRALTAMSPLQYQKQLRLHTARERMLLDGIDASTAAFDVGYESVSQFNREYSRLFGQPPMRDVKSLRSSPGQPPSRL